MKATWVRKVSPRINAELSRLKEINGEMLEALEFSLVALKRANADMAMYADMEDARGLVLSAAIEIQAAISRAEAPR